jgi:hypothetical protein
VISMKPHNSHDSHMHFHCGSPQVIQDTAHSHNSHFSERKKRVARFRQLWKDRGRTHSRNVWELWEKWESHRNFNGLRRTTSPIQVGGRTARLAVKHEAAARLDLADVVELSGANQFGL